LAKFAETEFSNIAVLIDTENISHKYLKKIFESIAVYGQISVRRIYADWTDNKRKAWKELIHDYALMPIQQFANKGTDQYAKNVSDFALVIDAMDLLHEGIFDCFCIVSSDSDFTRLAQRIREKGKFVIGLGEKKSISAFINACNTFIYLDDKTEEPDDKTEEKEAGAEESVRTSRRRHNGERNSLDSLMSKAIDKLANQDDGWAEMSKIIPYLKQIKSDFDLSEYKVDGRPLNRLGLYFKNNSNYECSELSHGKAVVRKKEKDV